MRATRDPSDPAPSAPNARLKVENDTTEGAAVCTLMGDLDLHTLPIAEPALEGALTGRPPVLCVDMRDVHFCDSRGLNLLLTLRERCSELGTALALVAPSARVARLLELTDADALFPVFPDSASAVAGLRRRV
jgi:anti-sigma B factor antagonist